MRRVSVPRAARRPILALDMATSTGWALRDRAGAVTSGAQVLELRRGESAGMRFLRFRGWLREVMERAGSSGLLAYEAAHHRGGHATALCVGLATVALEEAAARGWETASVHTASLKKHATGRGGASKDDMRAAAQARWGRSELPGEDEADALCVLAWAMNEIGEQ